MRRKRPPRPPRPPGPPANPPLLLLLLIWLDWLVEPPASVWLLLALLCSLYSTSTLRPMNDRIAGTDALPRCARDSSLKTTIRNAVLRSLPEPSLMLRRSLRMSCGDSSAGTDGAADTMTVGAGAGLLLVAAAAWSCAFSTSHWAWAAFNCAAF